MLAFGCAPHAASGRAPLHVHAGLFMRRDGSEEQIFSTTEKGTPMTPTNARDTDNTAEAQFLAPETHQRAAGDWQSYPTPEKLADKAWKKFKSRAVERLLDACSGAGALADAWERNRRDHYSHGRNYALPVDVIEIDARHHPMLREKNYNVVGLDFLQFQGGAIYSHVILNPPFAQGARFALKAWDMLWEGEVVAILNAETLRNPFSAERKRLAALVEEFGSVEFIEDAFVGADVERVTSVEIALIHLEKPAQCSHDWLGPVIESLAVEPQSEEKFDLPHELALPNDFVTNQCLSFRAAVRAMREAVRSEAVAEHFAARIGDTMARRQGDAARTASPTTGAGVRKALRERYLDLKDRAWASVLRSTDTLAKLSAKVQAQAESQFEQIKTLEFTESNIYGFLLGLVESQPEMQLDMACDVFDQIIRHHTENTVFYRGWKSNDRHRTCGMRIKTTRFILPGHSTDSWRRGLPFDSQRVLSDFDKVFALLDGKRKPEVGLVDVFDTSFAALAGGERISTSYFDVRYYPGVGTIHFFARDRALVDRLNRLVGGRRQWLPPETPDDSAFWTQYNKAEKFDGEVRKAVRARRAEEGGYYSARYDDPFRALVNNYDCDGARTAATTRLASAIDDVLSKHGLLDAITNDSQSGTQALLIEA